MISDETVVVPAKAWQDLIHHPYTTTYIKHNLSAFVSLNCFDLVIPNTYVQWNKALFNEKS